MLQAIYKRINKASFPINVKRPWFLFQDFEFTQKGTDVKDRRLS